MATSRLPALSSLLGRQLRTLRAPIQQRRWAQVQDVRFVATTQPRRSVIEKYREKLERKAREEHLQDINQLKAAYADKIQEVRKKDGVSVPGLDALLSDEPPPQTQSQDSTTTTTGTTATSPHPPSPSSPSAGKASIKPLSSLLDLPKVRALPLKELTTIWRLRHASSSLTLCAAIPTSTYTSISTTALRHPTFVLPVPRPGAGAEIHFLQWVFDRESSTATVLFTQLAEYKARGEWAQPHTSVTHYWDSGLAEGPAQAVLMAGSVVEGRGATVEDARWLVMLMQRFYGPEGTQGTGEKGRLLEEFSRGDGSFSVERLLEESEKLG
ncbi:ATP11 protein-domain-containing protein [Pseudomassariella vexata]|uniref:ATP11 protein-domain-containing protein n=1 Tax=Pseudomassariella vexata TaxID=1141098 RepID=A0A1Y2E4R2_9PEZI|nr:ATP11 protein-domain-containing protein [Pseudomassariella vexata]ORY66286.1 ATP11 protein-domain-containing protein [Pseudomassariella vexata]